MRIIGWHLLRLVAEAQIDLVGTTVESIRRNRDNGRALMILGSKRGRRYLLIGTRQPGTCFQWTRDKLSIAQFEQYTPTESLNRLRGMHLSELTIPRPDRWIRLQFHRYDRERGEATMRTAIVSWTRAAGNIMLLDHEGHVLESWVSGEEEKQKPLFIPPDPPRLIDWRTITFPDYHRLRAERSGESVDKFVKNQFWGIDSPLASVIAEQVEDREPVAESLGQSTDMWHEFEVVIDTLRRAILPSTPIRIPELSPILAASPVDVAGAPPIVPARSLATALTLVDSENQETVNTQSGRQRLRVEISKRLRKSSRRVTAAKRAVEHGEHVDRLTRNADLLGANRHLLKRGIEEVTLTDWTTGENISIKINKAKSTQENIDAAYRRARDAARAAQQAAGVLSQLTEEQQRWEMLLEEVDDETISPDRVDELQQTLAVGVKDAGSARRQPKRLPYREFKIGGYRLLVGRSSRDNDTLTLHIAKPGDLFFHAQGVSGSHVILKQGGGVKEPEQQIIIQAAQTAAHFSRARHSGMVPVAYTDVRYVRKPRKAPPGLVRLEREKTLMVKPVPPPGYHDE